MTQEQVDRNLKWGIFFSILWLAGIGSLLAIILGFKAKKAITASNGGLVGNSRAWWCLIVGGIGIILWVPLIVIAVFNQF